jgi:putative ubiquitin-RnfH superfamily antitoxin RatB of RatAB toxin-antitoxin module
MPTRFSISIRVEVIYALSQRQLRVQLDLPPESRVLDAVQASGLLQHLPQGAGWRIGVWGRSVYPETRLVDRDRVEIYRPLSADPKDVRRHRAARTRR